MNILIPGWFFGINSIIYILCAFIGFGITYYAYKSYSITKNNNHLLLYMAFTVLSMGFFVYGVIDTYSFLNLTSTGVMQSESVFGQFVSFRDFGIWIYYFCSLIAYTIFAYMYLPKKIKFLPAFFLPFWQKGFPYFHIASMFLISYTVFRSAINYFMKRTTSTLLVFLGFLGIGFYHVVMFFTSVSEYVFVAGHIALVLGFLSFLFMLIRVGRK